MKNLRLLMATVFWIKSITFSSNVNELPYSTTYRFPNAFPGLSIEVQKVCDLATGSTRFSSNSEYIRSPEDLVKMERQEELMARKKFGALAGRAMDKFQGLNPGEKTDVVISLKEPDGIFYLDKTKNSTEALRNQGQTVSLLGPVVSIDAFLTRYGIKSKERISSKSFHCETTKEDLEKIIFDKDVAAIDEYSVEVPSQSGIPDLLTSLGPSAYYHNTSAVPSTAGAGVNAATFETGIDPTVLSCFGGTIVSSQIDQRTQPWTFWEHSQWTFRSLMISASGANFWHRNSTSFDGTDDINFLINKGIQTASLSYARGADSPYSETYPEFRTMDDFAYHSPFPVFCNPSHNDGYQYVANWQCFNAINVGNVRHTSLTHFELPDTSLATGGCTQTTNPLAKYGSTRDREMPSIVAPGWAMHEYCVSTTGIWCGTSLSAPVTNGIAADVIAADSRMQQWPEKVRVVLLATAQNVDRGYWSYTSDGRDGAGVIHGANAVSFAQNHVSVYPTGSAVPDGVPSHAVAA